MGAYIQFNTGNGKGKTTADLGLSVQALGAGKRVMFLQFMKNLAFSELPLMSKLTPELSIEFFRKPFFYSSGCG